MRAHYLQHVSFEGPGYIETWLKNHQHVVSCTRFYEKGYCLPSVSQVDALIVMGGPMSIYDDVRYPWLQEEKAFIRDCIGAGKKVLGICLGAQLIADALGARVDSATNKEIGWYPVMSTHESRLLSWFYELFQNSPVVFHWHGDRFGIPEGSLDLLWSKANNNQAFAYRDNILALQFHLEVTMDTVNQMLENGLTELGSGLYIQHIDQILDGTGYIGQCNKMMNVILSKWTQS